MADLFPGVHSIVSAYNSARSSVITRGGLVSTNKNSLIAPGGNWYNKRSEQYMIMQAAYEGSIFKDNRKWQKYLSDRDLHEKTICTENPVQRLCDFYASHLYPGYLSPTGYPDAANVPLAIPIVNADDETKLALAQLWDWSNWQMTMITWIRTTASLGDGPLEVVDDVANGQVRVELVRPEFITDIRVDGVGNVIYYVKQLEVWDPIQETYYEHTRVVDINTITVYRDGQEEVSYANPYGFVPLVWCKHRDPGVGIFPGMPAIRDWGKVEELNSDITRVRMFIRKQALTPQLLTGMGEIIPYITEEDGSVFDIEDMLLMTASEQGSVHKLEGNLSVGDALDAIATIRAEINEDHPELHAHADFTNMSQATGPATKNILSNITNLVYLASKTYDDSTIKIHRMLLSIAGYRANERKGGWANLTEGQKRFLPYSLDSFRNGQLTFAISPREVSVMSEYDMAETDRQKFIAMAAASRAGVPLEWYLKDKGWKPDQIKELLEMQEKQFDRELERARKIQEASIGSAAALIPQIGKDAIISNVPLAGAGGKAPTTSAPGNPKTPANPGSQTTVGNSVAKSITSQQTN